MSTKADDIVKEGKELAKIHPNVVVKVPMTEEGLKATKALAKTSKDISEVTLWSKSQITKGSSRNISAPLTRCRMDTTPAGGSRYDRI